MGSDSMPELSMCLYVFGLFLYFHVMLSHLDLFGETIKMNTGFYIIVGRELAQNFKLYYGLDYMQLDSSVIFQPIIQTTISSVAIDHPM